MAMTKHIKSFDPLIMAMIHGRRGEVKKAAALFAQAITASDAILAIRTLEQNNQKAFAVEASARSNQAKKIAAKKQTASKKKVHADEFEIEGEDPMLEEEEVIESSEEGDEEDDEDVHVDINVDGDDEEEEDSEDEGDQTFEATLASFLKKGKSGK